MALAIGSRYQSPTKTVNPHPQNNQQRTKRILKESEQEQVRSFGDYMELKKRKLHNQVHENVVPKTNIFAGISIYVNGYTDPPASSLRQIFVENGGEYHHYFTNHETTYMIASAMATSKWKTLGRRNADNVVRPEWIFECLKAGKRLPVGDFLLKHTIKVPKQFGIPTSMMKNSGCRYERQLLLTDYANVRKRNKIINGYWKKKAEEKEDTNEQNSNNNIPQKIDTSLKRPQRLLFEYGIGTKPNTIFICKLEIDYTEEVKCDFPEQLLAIYKYLLEQYDFCAIQSSVRFMSRIFISQPNCNPDWLAVVAHLKVWVNQECLRRTGAIIFNWSSE